LVFNRIILLYITNYAETLTDEAIIHNIRQGGQARDAALQHLYLRAGVREAVARVVADTGGAQTDAQDVFQEAFVLFDRNVREGKFDGRSSLTTYLVAIAKWHWLNVRRREGRYTQLEPAQHEGTADSPEVTTIQAEQRAMLTAALDQIGERCKQLLTLYQMSCSMTEIADLMGYQTPDVAKKEAYRCRLKLRERLMATKEF
jgi:RNA polymerase sigma factor (sigma-70 family)